MIIRTVVSEVSSFVSKPVKKYFCSSENWKDRARSWTKLPSLYICLDLDFKKSENKQIWKETTWNVIFSLKYWYRQNCLIHSWSRVFDTALHPQLLVCYSAVVCSTMTKEIVRFRGEWLQHNNLSKVSYLTFNGLFYNLRECSEEESIKTLQIRKNMHLLLRQGPF